MKLESFVQQLTLDLKINPLTNTENGYRLMLDNSLTVLIRAFRNIIVFDSPAPLIFKNHFQKEEKMARAINYSLTWDKSDTVLTRTFNNPPSQRLTICDDFQQKSTDHFQLSKVKAGTPEREFSLRVQTLVTPDTSYPIIRQTLDSHCAFIELLKETLMDNQYPPHQQSLAVSFIDSI